MRLFLVRHGQTVWTAQHRYQGMTDVPLNAQGVREAKALGRVLCHESPDRIFSSALGRSRETAHWIAQAAKLRTVEDERLNEISFGKWEGKPWRERRFHKAPGGESVESLAKRVNRFFKDLIKKYLDETIVLVSHAGPIRMFLIQALMGARTYKSLLSIWSFRVDPASISLIEGTPELFQIAWANRTDHLNSNE